MVLVNVFIQIFFLLKIFLNYKYFPVFFTNFHYDPIIEINIKKNHNNIDYIINSYAKYINNSDIIIYDKAIIIGLEIFDKTNCITNNKLELLNI